LEDDFMRKMSHLKKSIVTAACIALCVVLPMALHSVPGAGRIFLPVHIPVLLCGLLCGWPFGLLAGLAGPLLSSLLTGMPPSASLPSIMLELVTYGAVSGIGMQWVRTQKLYADLYVSLVSAMLVGRILAGVSWALIFAPGSYSMAIWTTSFFLTSLPGMAIQLALIPSAVVALEAARLIPKRYPKQRQDAAKPA
jgi:thiamine transporter ThiT